MTRFSTSLSSYSALNTDVVDSTEENKTVFYDLFANFVITKRRGRKIIQCSGRIGRELHTDTFLDGLNYMLYFTRGQ